MLWRSYSSGLFLVLGDCPWAPLRLAEREEVAMIQSSNERTVKFFSLADSVTPDQAPKTSQTIGTGPQPFLLRL